MNFLLTINTTNLAHAINIINVFILITVLIVCANYFAPFFKKFTKLFAIISVCIITFNIIYYVSLYKNYQEPNNITNTNNFKDISDYNLNFVAHASGGIDNIDYLNCQESFIKSAEKGFKYIELDFVTSSDGEVFCAHTFEHFNGFSFENKPTINQVKNTKLYGKYTPITLDWLFEKLIEYPDIKIIYDTKEDIEIEILNKIISESKKINFDIKERFIIQVYSINNYIYANQLKFKEYWFSNYKTLYTAEEIKYFEQRENVTTLVINYNNKLCTNYLNGTFNTTKKFAVYTINDKTIWQTLENKNIDYVFIDFY